VTGTVWMGGIATGAGIARGDEQDVSGKTRAFLSAFDADFVFFQRLAQPFECGTRELGKFVEEEHAAVGAREFARSHGAPSAEQSLG